MTILALVVQNTRLVPALVVPRVCWLYFFRRLVPLQHIRLPVISIGQAFCLVPRTVPQRFS
jgi:hypothetical protein